MDHLDEHRLFDLLREPPTPPEAEHLEKCPRCRRRLDSWKTIVAELRELDSQELPEAETHNLRVLFRELGPSPSRRRLIARLVRPLAQPAGAAATRGPLTASLAEYRAGDVSLILHVSPSRRPEQYEIHGTIQGQPAVGPEGRAVVLSSGEGYADVTETDALGEFHFNDVPGGRYHVSCLLGDGQLEAEDLPVGAAGEEADA